MVKEKTRYHYTFFYLSNPCCLEQDRSFRRKMSFRQIHWMSKTSFLLLFNPSHFSTLCTDTSQLNDEVPTLHQNQSTPFCHDGFVTLCFNRSLSFKLTSEWNQRTMVLKQLHRTQFFLQHHLKRKWTHWTKMPNLTLLLFSINALYTLKFILHRDYNCLITLLLIWVASKSLRLWGGYEAFALLAMYMSITFMPFTINVKVSWAVATKSSNHGEATF